MSGKTGVLVIGHGTADPVGAAETRQVAATVASLLPGTPVELGFLEVIAPTIDAAVARLAAAGCSHLVAAPLLLFTAGHAKRDVPEAVAAAAAAHAMSVRQTEALGEIDEVLELSAVRRREAVGRMAAVPDEETTLVVIGRGSSDPAAAAQLRSFVEASFARGSANRPRRLELGFVAAARPRMDDAIAAACDPVDPGVRRIIVQPHLLFRGHVEDQVSDAMDCGRTRRPDLEWVQAARLGADPLVARAIVRRIMEVVEAESLSRQG